MIRLRYDSRDKIFRQRFGAVTEPFPNELLLDSKFFDEIQPGGDVKCVAYTICDIAEDQQGIEFDISSILDLWARVPSVAQGSDPRDVLGETVKNGLLPKGAKERVKIWKSYWRADLGDKDSFDNVRSALMLTKKACLGAGTYWYWEWPRSGIMPVGKNPGFGHMYAIEGWKRVNGEPHFIIEAWTGNKLLMSREVFNEALKPRGMQTWVLSTAEIDEKRVKTLIETIKDVMINLILLLKEKIMELTPHEAPSVPVEPVLTPTEPVLVGSRIIEWAQAIEEFEKTAKWRNNPGAIRGTDGKFIVFKSYKEGFDYLCKYLERACTGKHKAYKPTMTLKQFFSVYAPWHDSNNPDLYADFVAKRLGIASSTVISTLV